MTQYRSFYTDTVNEDYPAAWNKEEFEKIRSFAGKLKYANERLTKLATGSGRAVFKIDEQKVLKIAKNKKGLAQNSVEGEAFIQNFSIVAKTFDVGDYLDNGPFWVEMELAKKVGKPRFKQLNGISVEDTERYLTKFFGKARSWAGMGDEEAEAYHENEFIQEMMNLVGNYDMSTGDFGRTSTYGEVMRDGVPKIVLVDFGLTNQVWDDYYKVKI
jgi:hypothetical protein